MLHCQCQVINKNSIFQLVQSDGHVCKSCVVKVSYAQKNKNKKTHTLSLVSFTTHVIKKEKEKQMQKKKSGQKQTSIKLTFLFQVP